MGDKLVSKRKTPKSTKKIIKKKASVKIQKVKVQKTKVQKIEKIKIEKPVVSDEEKKFTKLVSSILSDSEVRQSLIDMGGENALAIVKNFYGNHSDDDLAKKLKIKISDVRATLNKLHNEGLVNYIREKDSETGWYSYSWTLNHQRMEMWAERQLNKGAVLEGGVEYYFCPSCGASSITNFESASNTQFRCGNCERLLEYADEKRMTELYQKK